MDLRKQQITVGELLDDPASQAVLKRRFPLVFRRKFSPAARSVTLEQLIDLVGVFLPQRTVAETLEELRRL